MRKIKKPKDLGKDVPIYLAQRIDMQIKFFCPYCLIYHFHGLGPVEKSDSKPFVAEHRVAHCPMSDRPLAHEQGYYFFYEK